MNMNKSWDGKLMQGMQELPMETSASIIAGDSLFYWIGYGFGLVTSLFTNSTTGQK
jgi:hypothetical protein